MNLAARIMITSAAALVFVCQPALAKAGSRESAAVIWQYDTQPVTGSLGVGGFQVVAQNSSQDNYIPPSVALRNALRYAPGSKGLDVRLRKGPQPVYAVKLKSGNRIHRIMIDARTGKRVGG
jgi:uncharacterized membrane protein YkoI